MRLLRTKIEGKWEMAECGRWRKGRPASSCCVHRQLGRVAGCLRGCSAPLPLPCPGKSSDVYSGCSQGDVDKVTALAAKVDDNEFVLLNVEALLQAK